MCPACSEHLVVYELGGVEIDHCLACGGTWLDHGELERIGAFAGASAERLARAIREAPRGKKGARRCPRCVRVKLRSFLLDAPSPVELDRCPRCNGIWLDRGEVERTIASFREGDEAPMASFFAELFKAGRKGA